MSRTALSGLLLGILGLAMLAGPARCQTGGAVNEASVGSAIDDYLAMVREAQAGQPRWSSPLVTTTALLEERFRFDTSFQRQGNGNNTTVIDGGRGLDLIVGPTEEIQIAAAPYDIREGGRRRTRFSGFGDWPVLRFKQRLYSDDETIVSAWLQLQVPAGIARLTNGVATLAPTIGAGRSFGPLVVQGTFGATIPMAREREVGMQIAGNVAVQAHVLSVLWPQIEANWTYYPDARRGGLNQVYLTPGIVVGRLPLAGPVHFTIGAGYQTAVAPRVRLSPLTPGYDHAWLLTARVSI